MQSTDTALDGSVDTVIRQNTKYKTTRLYGKHPKAAESRATAPKMMNPCDSGDPLIELQQHVKFHTCPKFRLNMAIKLSLASLHANRDAKT